MFLAVSFFGVKYHLGRIDFETLLLQLILYKFVQKSCLFRGVIQKHLYARLLLTVLLRLLMLRHCRPWTIPQTTLTLRLLSRIYRRSLNALL